VIAWLVSVAAAVTLFTGWWHPGSTLCAALGWSSLPLFFVALSIPRRRVTRLFVSGIATYIGGFYWLFSTISDFGGFPTIAALAIFALFAVGSAVQFAIWAFCWQHLPAWCTRWGVRTALSWLVAHHFWIKIFPWDFGHTQLAFTQFAQLAGVTGVTGITWVMMWVVETLCARRTATVVARAMSLTTLIVAIGYGVWIEETLQKAPSNPLQTVLVQGNVSLQRKHDISYFTVNREQYLKTSQLVSSKDTLIVWPESTITDFIPASITNSQEAPLLPHLGDGSAFLVGGLTYRSSKEYYNSSILIRPDGSVAEPYNKIILMPFGEYTPFASLMPWLAEINATAGQFTAGSGPAVLSFPLSDGRQVRLSPLICYEDIVPELARDATRRGAEVLINQTNDAWFGDTIAPHQHHMIAAFRAIENRRYLLRSTNTGLTAVVDPLGQTLASLLPYTESVLPMEVTLLTYQSTYTQLPISLMWLALASITVFAICALLIRSRSRSQKSL